MGDGPWGVSLEERHVFNSGGPTAPYVLCIELRVQGRRTWDAANLRRGHEATWVVGGMLDHCQESRARQTLTSYETPHQPPGASGSLVIKRAPLLPNGTGRYGGEGTAFCQVKSTRWIALWLVQIETRLEWGRTGGKKMKATGPTHPRISQVSQNSEGIPESLRQP